MATNIEIKPVVELLNGDEGTHLDDLDGLREKVYQYASIARLIGKEHIEIDFTGYTIPDINLVNNMLESVTTALGITFSCSNWSLPGMTASENGCDILKDYERDELSDANTFEYTYNQLCGLVDAHLKYNEHCVLDFTNICITPSMTEGAGVRLSGEEFSITKTQSLIILIKLKAKYGGKLTFTGLNYHSNSKLSYAIGYFTMPHCNTVEEVREFITSEYKPNDFVFLNALEIKHTVSDKVTDYNPRRVEKLMMINDVFALAEIDRSNLQLGLVVSCDETSISILPLRIESSSTAEELKKGRFKYTLMESAMVVDYADLLGDIKSGVIKKVIHGVDMTTDCEKLYEVVKDLSPNPPRERNIYYSEERQQMYQNYLYSLIEEEKFKEINIAPTLENIAKATDVGPAYFKPTDLI